MTYGDYYAATPTVKTLYFGYDHEALLEACRDGSIYCNGSPIFNVIHEGLAAVLDVSAAHRDSTGALCCPTYK